MISPGPKTLPSLLSSISSWLKVTPARLETMTFDWLSGLVHDVDRLGGCCDRWNDGEDGLGESEGESTRVKVGLSSGEKGNMERSHM